MIFTLLLLLSTVCATELKSDLSFQRVKRDGDLDKTWEALKQAWSSLGDFFANKVKSVQDLFATKKDELQIKVQETADFLQKVKDNQENMIRAAGEKGMNATQDALAKVESWQSDVKAFQEKVTADTSAKVDEITTEWNDKAKNMYNGGLDKVIDMAQSLKSSSMKAIAYCLPVLFGLITVVLIR